MSNRLLTPITVLVILVTLCGTDATAQNVTIGKANYLTKLPLGADGKPRRSIDAKPLVSSRITDPLPTNDWCSSLVWPSSSPHSLAMFPHPLAVKAHASGLGLGYTPFPVITDSSKDGKLFQKGSNYKFPYRESMIIGLKGLNSPNTLLDHHSDWAVTSLWDSSPNKLRATFGHGLPFVYFEREGDQPAVVQFKKAQFNRHVKPVAPLTFEFKNINGRHTQADGKFSLAVNAGKNIGLGSKVQIRYDFDGDGQTDRVEVFSLFASDPVDTSWETYSDVNQKLDAKLTTGEKQNFKNGVVTLEFWKVFGDGQVALNLEDCKIELPIKNGSQRLKVAHVLGSQPVDNIVQTKPEGEKTADVFYRAKNIIGVTVNRTHYGLFAPRGATWLPADASVDAVHSKLADKDYFSVAVLPDATPNTIKVFAKHAFAFVADTEVTYQYAPETSTVETTYTVTTTPKEGSETRTVMALYRHQHLLLADSTKHPPLAKLNYISPRGKMKVITGDSFTTSTPFLGVLPSLPTPKESFASLRPMVDAYYKDLSTRKNTFQRNDTYWNGKEFGKISEVIHIADQIGKHKIRDELVKLLQARLESWFDGKDQERFFYYNQQWNTLVGYPDSYGSADILNDHHFHYSYFIKAAATIAKFDPDWVKPENYGGMIDLLIRNCANYDRTDKRFPWMRFFDPYAGHSWASGNAGFASGNNQESSSESMNFASSLILYGQAIGDRKIRDLGIYWHATEAEAIRNYWFDNDQQVFPQGFGSPCVGMVWGDGGTYGTWWTANPEEIHGINFLPLTGGSLYLARDQNFVKQNFAALQASNKRFHNAGFDGDPNKLTRWQDIIFEYLALADPIEADRLYQANGVDTNSEFGETKAHTAQWIAALKSLGQYDESVRANSPTALCFTKLDKTIYIAYNASSKTSTVTFTDGAKFDVPPGLHQFTEN